MGLGKPVLENCKRLRSPCKVPFKNRKAEALHAGSVRPCPQSLLVLVKEGIIALKKPEKCPVLPSVSMSKLTSHSDSRSRDTPLGQAGEVVPGAFGADGSGGQPARSPRPAGARRDAQCWCSESPLCTQDLLWNLASRPDLRLSVRSSRWNTPRRRPVCPPSANHESSFRLSPKVFPSRSLSSAPALFPAGE